MRFRRRVLEGLPSVITSLLPEAICVEARNKREQWAGGASAKRVQGGTGARAQACHVAGLRRRMRSGAVEDLVWVRVRGRRACVERTGG